MGSTLQARAQATLHRINPPLAGLHVGRMATLAALDALPAPFADEDTKWLKSVAVYLVPCSDEIVKSHIEHALEHAESVVNRSGPPEPALAG